MNVKKHIKVKNEQSKKILVALIFTILNILLLIPILNNLVDINGIAIISIIQLLLSIVSLMVCGYKIFTLPILFIGFNYVFHLGQLILVLLKREDYIILNIMNMVPMDVCIRAYTFVISCNITLVLGIIFSNLRNYDKNSIKKEDNNLLSRVFKIGLIFVIIGIVPTIYITICKLQVFLQGNYLSIYDMEINGAISLLSKPFNIGTIMIMIAKKDNKKVARLIFISIVCFQIVTMFIGERSKQVIIILALVYVYINVVKSISIKKGVIFITQGYIGLAILNVIMKFRMEGALTFSEIISNIIKTLKDSPILATMGEFSITMVTLVNTVMLTPNIVSYNYGFTYIISALSVYPNFGGVLNSIVDKYAYINYFPTQYSYGLGGSYLGELYFNFGMYGIIMVTFVGVFIGFVDKKLSSAIRNNEWISFSIWIILFQNIILWIRDYFNILIFDFVWLGIGIILLNKLLNKSTKSKRVLK